MRFKAALLVLALALLIPLAAQAAPPAQPMTPADGNWYCPPPRFQVYHAPGRYGGMIMVDNQTGEVYQRVIVNTNKGIDIRWLKLERSKALRPGETIVWE